MHQFEYRNPDCDPVRAAAAYRRGCELDDGESCFQLSWLYQEGKGVAADAAQARQLSDKACRAGLAKACSAAAPAARAPQ